MTKIETLVLKYFHGMCSETELLQLRQAMIVEPEALRLFIRTAEEEVMLRELCRAKVEEGVDEKRAVPIVQFLWHKVLPAVAGIMIIAILGYLLNEQLKYRPALEFSTGIDESGVVHYTHRTTSIFLKENTRIQFPDTRLVSRVQKKNSFEAVVEAFSHNRLEVKLNEGTIRLTAEHKKDEQKAFIILTPHARVSVIGTKLQLATSVMGTRLEVENGVAEFNPLGTRTNYIVSGGEYAQIESGAPAVLIGKIPVFITPEVKRTIQIDSQIKDPVAIASDGSSLFVVADKSCVLWKIDATDGRVLKEYNLKNTVSNPEDLAWDGKQLWILDSGKLVKFDPSTEKVTGSITVGLHWKRITYGNGCIWGTTSIIRKMDEENVWRRVEKIDTNGKKCGSIEYLQLGTLSHHRLLPFAYMEGYLWVRYETRIFPVRTVDGAVISRRVVPLSSVFTDDVASGVGSDSDCVWFLDKKEHVAHLVKLIRENHSGG
jgi:hypothetical protein